MSRRIKWHKIDELMDYGLTDSENERPPVNSQSANPLILELNVAGKTICMANREGAWHAFAAKCPHASGRLAEGWLDPLGQVVCPLHRYKFNITNGRNTSGEGYHLKTYPVEVRPDGVYVGMEEGGLGFGLFR
jgi:nitrite reductase/ring-hydroxylating ferredoxin subunit